jgi:hypothetical protein
MGSWHRQQTRGQAPSTSLRMTFTEVLVGWRSLRRVHRGGVHAMKGVHSLFLLRAEAAALIAA